jgi:hypothetical protein
LEIIVTTRAHEIFTIFTQFEAPFFSLTITTFQNCGSSCLKKEGVLHFSLYCCNDSSYDPTNILLENHYLWINWVNSQDPCTCNNLTKLEKK